MNKHLQFFGIITILSSLLLISGCTEQKKPSTEETIQTLLEKAAVIDSIYYEIDASFVVDGAEMQTTTITVWQQTPYLKEEENSTSGNISTTRLIIQRPDGAYLYDPTSQTYQPNTIANLPQPSTQTMVNDLLNNQTLTIIGTENISNTPTTIIQYHPNQGGNSTTVTLWIWNEKGVPLKEQFTSNAEGTMVTINTIYSNYSFEDIPDSTFNVE